MQLSSPRKKSLVNLTPLIDVVFILLIFFMLASNFMQWHVLELSVGEVNKVEVSFQALSIISINADSTYLLNKQAMPLDQLVDTLKARVAKQHDHVISIQPEQGANVQALVDILNKLRQFAGDNISLVEPTNIKD